MSNDSETAEIPALGEGYSHARKAYGLVSALLMAWELIGVELQASPIENLKLTLKSPQAAPYVLIVLILYFGFRVTIEWYQTDVRRRQLRASRIDFVAAHAIAVAALGLYGVQTLLKIQVANTIPADRLSPFALGVGSAQVLYMVVRSREEIRHWRENLFFSSAIVLSALGLLGACVWLFYSAGVGRSKGVLFLFALGVISASIAIAFLNWIMNKLVSSPDRKSVKSIA